MKNNIEEERRRAVFDANKKMTKLREDLAKEVETSRRLKIDQASQIREVQTTADKVLQDAMRRKTDDSQRGETMSREIQKLQTSNNELTRTVQELTEKIQGLTKSLRDLKAENEELRAKLQSSSKVPPLPKGSQSSRGSSPVNDHLEQKVLRMAEEKVRSLIPQLLPQLAPAAAPAPQVALSCPQRVQPAAVAVTEIDRELAEHLRNQPTLNSTQTYWEDQGAYAWEINEDEWQSEYQTGTIPKQRRATSGSMPRVHSSSPADPSRHPDVLRRVQTELALARQRVEHLEAQTAQPTAAILDGLSERDAAVDIKQLRLLPLLSLPSSWNDFRAWMQCTLHSMVSYDTRENGRILCLRNDVKGRKAKGAEIR